MSLMKPSERDELLIRLDERSESTIRELQDQNKHLEENNGHILELFKEQASQRSKIKINRWLILAVILGGGGISGLTRIFGVWG